MIASASFRRGWGALPPLQDFSAEEKWKIPWKSQICFRITKLKKSAVKFYNSFKRQVSVILQCKLYVFVSLSVLHMNFSFKNLNMYICYCEIIAIIIACSDSYPLTQQCTDVRLFCRCSWAGKSESFEVWGEGWSCHMSLRPKLQLHDCLCW